MAIQTGLCPQCQALNSNTSINCLECQSRLPWAAQAEAALAEAAALRAQQAQLPPAPAPVAGPPGAHQGPAARQGMPQLYSQRAQMVQAASAAGGEAGNRYQRFFSHFFGPLADMFSEMDGGSALVVGGMSALASIGLTLLGLYLMFGRGSGGALISMMGAGGLIKIVGVALIPFICLTALCALVRSMAEESSGDFGGDVLVAGMALLPLGLGALLSGLVSMAGMDMATSATVFYALFMICGCYMLFMLYDGLIVVGRVSHVVAAASVPIIILASGWLTSFIMTKLVFGGMI